MKRKISGYQFWADKVDGSVIGLGLSFNGRSELETDPGTHLIPRLSLVYGIVLPEYEPSYYNIDVRSNEILMY